MLEILASVLFAILEGTAIFAIAFILYTAFCKPPRGPR